MDQAIPARSAGLAAEARRLAPELAAAAAADDALRRLPDAHLEAPARGRLPARPAAGALGRRRGRRCSSSSTRRSSSRARRRRRAGWRA